MKKYILILLVILGSIGVTNAFFCKEDGKAIDNPVKPPVCNETPPVIEEYLEDMTYVIELGKGKPNLKRSNSLGAKALNTIMGNYEVAEGFFPTLMPNFFANFVILKDQKYVVRDWAKLINFKSYISSTALGYMRKNNAYDVIDDGKLKQIQETIKAKDSFLFYFNGKTRKDLNNFLWLNQQAMETLYKDNVFDLKSKEDSLSNLVDSDIIVKNPKHIMNTINKLKKTYFSDNNKVSCDENWNETIKKLHNLVCEIGKRKVDKIFERFKCSYERLKDALGLGKPTNMKCQANLKPFVPLQERIKLRGNFSKEFGKMIKSVQDSAGIINDTLSSIGDTVEYREQNSALAVTPEQRPKKIQENMLKTNLYNISNDIVDERDKVTNMLMQVDSGKATHNVPEKIVKTSQSIHRMIDKLIRDDDNIYSTLVKVCSHQSPNLGNCRAPHNEDGEE